MGAVDGGLRGLSREVGRPRRAHESVSRTLEHAYDDWCAARFAEALGKKEVDGFVLKHADLVQGGELVFEMAAVSL